MPRLRSKLPLENRPSVISGVIQPIEPGTQSEPSALALGRSVDVDWSLLASTLLMILNGRPDESSISGAIVKSAKNFFQPLSPLRHEENAVKGKVSRYAWGDDYHDVVKEKLRELLFWIKAENTEADGKICVDTAPLMDKAWAVRAGLGWLGKHSNLITKDYGSWVFIGEILLNLELEYETEIIADHCGTCTACLDACPTNAIVAPFVVDSKVCISYATIELRSDELPQNITKNLNGWLYGCDICQDVCPWNRFEKPSEEMRFEPRLQNVSADLDEILALSPEKYAEKFRRSAMKRTKLSGLKRNAQALKTKKTLSKVSDKRL
jgi:epoxyqueuosine reductase